MAGLFGSGKDITPAAPVKVQVSATPQQIAAAALCEPLPELWDGQKLTLPAHWYAEAAWDAA